MKLYFATKNSRKVETAQRELSEFVIEIVQYDIDFSEPRSYRLEEIAAQKAREALGYLHAPLIAVDAGFYLERWPNFPGPFTNHALETLGLKGMLKLVDGEDRACRYMHVVAYVDEKLENPIFFSSSVEGSLSGEIDESPLRIGGSDIDRIFVPDGYDKPVSSMTDDEREEYRKGKTPVFTDFGGWLVNNRWNPDR